MRTGTRQTTPGLIETILRLLGRRPQPEPAPRPAAPAPARKGFGKRVRPDHDD